MTKESHRGSSRLADPVRPGTALVGLVSEQRGYTSPRTHNSIPMEIRQVVDKDGQFAFAGLRLGGVSRTDVIDD